MKKFLIPLICSAMALLCGCNINFDSSDTRNNDSKENLNFVHQKAKWTYLFYMPADNSLDSCVHDDLKEIEQSHFDDSEINMIALVDRSNKFKQGIDNWCGSRLYEMHPCVEGQDEQITSKRLSAIEFGVSSINDNPLDMGSAETLDAFIRYAKNYYPAEHYAIVIWGHGTGYRFENNPSSSRAVALDENSGTYLPMPELRKAVSSAAGDNVFDFIGFDTCFAASLEEVYELKDCGKYFAGTASVQMVSGWDYTKWLGAVSPDFETGLDVARALEQQYLESNDDTFSIVDLSKVEELVNDFNVFTSLASTLVCKESDAEYLKDSLMNKCRTYRVTGSHSNPVYVDMYDMLCKLSEWHSRLAPTGIELREKMFKTVLLRGESKTKKCPLGIFLCSVDTSNQIGPYSSYYVNGSGAVGQCSFVQDIVNYVPTKKNVGSFLDKIFGVFEFDRN